VPTHQSLTGSSDEYLLQRMVSTHADRYGDEYWAIFDAHVAPHLPRDAVVVDLGCGPGLFLRDVRERHPSATVYGYDVTPAMVAHARQLSWKGPAPIFAVHDLTKQPLPHAAGVAHLVSMSSVLHVLDEPLPVLAEIRRVLAPGGVFLLQDWIRQPLAAYLDFRRDVMGDAGPDAQRRSFQLFPVHNKYTPLDWRWLLAEAGLVIRHEAQLRASHRMFVTTSAGVAAVGT
jgi:SAM-dependent methyltransferase